MTQEEFERLVKAANQGDSEAIDALGKAAQQGDLRAINWMLGMYLKFGKFKTSLYSDVSRNVNAVREMLKKMQVDRVLVEKDYAYNDKSRFKNLSEVYIPEGTTRIGNEAFSWGELTYVYIPNSVTSIGKEAFHYCGRLTSITIPDSVISIEHSAFTNCGLTSITIPHSVTNIELYSFAHCEGLNSILVASGNTKYDSRDNCNAIIETATNTLIAGCQNTIIPHSVTSIGIGAFCGCEKISTITIPNSVTSIGCCAFEDCKSLTSITIPNSVTCIEEFAFSGCRSLTSITIPDSVVCVEGNTFDYCKNLSRIIVPKGKKSRFEQMDGLKKLADKIVEE